MLTLTETGYIGNGDTGARYYPYNVSIVFQNKKFVIKNVLRLGEKTVMKVHKETKHGIKHIISIKP